MGRQDLWQFLQLPQRCAVEPNKNMNAHVKRKLWQLEHLSLSVSHYWAVLSFGGVYCVVQGSSNFITLYKVVLTFLVCGWNHNVLPLTQKFLCCLLCCPGWTCWEGNLVCVACYYCLLPQVLTCSGSSSSFPSSFCSSLKSVSATLTAIRLKKMEVNWNSCYVNGLRSSNLNLSKWTGFYLLTLYSLIAHFQIAPVTADSSFLLSRR